MAELALVLAAVSLCASIICIVGLAMAHSGIRNLSAHVRPGLHNFRATTHEPAYELNPDGWEPCPRPEGKVDNRGMFRRIDGLIVRECPDGHWRIRLPANVRVLRGTASHEVIDLEDTGFSRATTAMKAADRWYPMEGRRDG